MNFLLKQKQSILIYNNDVGLRGALWVLFCKDVFRLEKSNSLDRVCLIWSGSSAGLAF